MRISPISERPCLLSLTGQPGNCARCSRGLGLAFRCHKQILQLTVTAGLHHPSHLFPPPSLLFLFQNWKKKNPTTKLHKYNWSLRCSSQFTTALLKVKMHVIIRNRIICCCVEQKTVVGFSSVLCRPEARVVTVTAKETQTDRWWRVQTAHPHIKRVRGRRVHGRNINWAQNKYSQYPPAPLKSSHKMRTATNMFILGKQPSLTWHVRLLL